MGDQRRRGHRDDSRDHDHGGREGLDQYEVSKGMGADSPLDGIKQKIRLSPTDGLSVGVLERWTIPGGGEEFKLTIHSVLEFQENHSSVLSEDEVGGVATSTDSNVRDRSLRGEDRTNGMEFDGGGDASPTN